MKIPCGFCEYRCPPGDLFSHVVTNHGNMMDHLQTELRLAMSPGMGPRCNVMIAGERCGKDAIVAPELIIPSLDKKSALHNPTPCGNLRYRVGCPFCGDHALLATTQDVLQIGVTRDLIEEYLGRGGVYADWLKIELVWNPFIPPASPS